MIFAGDKVPDFTLLDENDNPVTLSDLTQDSPVMIVFYPRDFSRLCTKQLCSYQSSMYRFVKYNLRVIGISPNSPEEHLSFKSKYSFTFTLLSDFDKAVAKAYHVISFLMLGGMGRAVFIVSKGGYLIYRHVEPTILTHRPPEQLLNELEKLRSNGKI